MQSKRRNEKRNKDDTMKRVQKSLESLLRRLAARRRGQVLRRRLVQIIEDKCEVEVAVAEAVRPVELTQMIVAKVSSTGVGSRPRLDLDRREAFMIPTMLPNQKVLANGSVTRGHNPQGQSREMKGHQYGPPEDQTAAEGKALGLHEGALKFMVDVFSHSVIHICSICWISVSMSMLAKKFKTGPHWPFLFYHPPPILPAIEVTLSASLAPLPTSLITSRNVVRASLSKPMPVVCDQYASVL